ncbi:hypothetical protein ACP4OV_000236 [Aristida adscensionis]
MKAYGTQLGCKKADDALGWFKEYYAHYDGMLQSSSQNHISSSPEETRSHRSRRSKLDTYLEDPLAPIRDDFEVLKWWKRNEETYPVLAKMSRDLLAIPLSTVASESTFSIAGMVINKNRSSLNPESVEALICSNDCLRKYISDSDDGDED